MVFKKTKPDSDDRIARLNECFLNFGVNPDDNINSLVKLCGEMLGASCALYNKLQSNLLCSLGHWNIPIDYNPVDKAEGHICYDVIRDGKDEPIVISDLKNSPYFKTDPNVSLYNLESYIGITVKYKKKAIGSLCAVFNKKFNPRVEDFELMSFLASAISIEEDRKATAKAIIEKESIYHTLFNNSPSGILIEDSNGNILDCNEAMLNLFGENRKEFLSKNVLDLVPENCKNEVGENIKKILSGEILDHYVVNIKKDGTECYLALRETKMILQNGEAGILVIANDVTRIKKTELALLESEERLRTLINSTPDIICFKDGEGRWLESNEAILDLFGIRNIDYKGKKDSELIKYNPAMKDAFLFCEMTDQKAFNKKTISRVEETILIPDGTKIIFDVIKNPLYFPDGKRKGLIVFGRDITKKKETELELQKSESKHRTIVENISEILYSMDLSGNFTYVSPLIEKFTLYKIEDIIGSNFSEYVCPEDLHYVKNRFERILEGFYEPSEYRIVDKDGKIKFIRSSSKLLIENEKATGIFGVIIDITDKKLAEEELRKAKEEAETATKIKSQFLATISHEIRTPMNGVIGMTGLLINTPLNDEQKDFVETIKSSGDILLSLMNDILDFSKIESGKLTLENQLFNIKHCIKDVLDLFSAQANERGLTLKSNISGLNSETAIGDVTRLRQVISNLVSNALKFTEKGSIEISAKTLKADKRNTEIQFSVKDSGIGISKESEKLLFQPFSQLDTTITKKYGGTGLGLIICKHLVSLMGGEIWLESETGLGTTFYFIIKCKMEKDGSREMESGASKEINYNLANECPINILLVEDNMINQKVTVRLLKKFGYNIDVAVNGLKALDAAKQKKYDIIFMDIQMPEMDGYEATKNIVKMYPAEKCPKIIAMTAAVMKGDKEKCLKAGMVDYIPKPVLPEAVQHAILKWCKK